ncbi:MAG: hypothetical protein WA802_04115 [Terracidiphilus sp.]
MTDEVPALRKRFVTRYDEVADVLARPGRAIFSFAIVALGVETLVCARTSQNPLGPGYNAIPVLPWVPAIPWLAVAFGAIWIMCGAGLLLRRWLRASAFLLGALLAACALVIVLPRYVALPGDMGLRTVVLEPLTLACMALLMAGRATVPAWLARACCVMIAIAMIVFGVDHFLGLVFIGSLLPNWIPWHLFWVALFGVVFIACGIGIGLRILERWSWLGIGLMFGIWVITLHVPRTLGFYGVPGALTDPDEWSSLFIAMGIWGGSWALVAQSKLITGDRGV